MKEVITFIKNVWKNKRQRALLSLFLWFIFFVIVFALVGGPVNIDEEYRRRLTDEESEVSNSPIENFANMDNYEFNYLITIINNGVSNNQIITGTYYKGGYFFTLNGVKYYIKDNLYKVDDLNKTLNLFKDDDPNNILNIIDVQLFTKEKLLPMLKDGEYGSSTTYKDKSVVTNYTYEINNHIINLETNEYEHIINSIEIDLTDYYDKKYSEVKVTISYKNINNIVDYKTDYTDYQIVKEGA